MTLTDFAADNYYARHDGTEPVDVDAPDELDESAAWERRVIGEAHLYGGKRTATVAPWATCWCTDGEHHYLKRDNHMVNEADCDEWIAAARERGTEPHKVTRRTVTVQGEWVVIPTRPGGAA
ncbi:hypothetical protein [Actinotalea sp.]|uniref:hypothetical protein n=1 Tax=Actinotalea sp. TaxID=1872145 RepID=UPI00356A5A9E